MPVDSYTLEVLANTRAYIEKMAEIPGVTQKQAARAGLAWQKEQVKAQQETARAAKKAAEDAADVWATIGGSADRVGGAAKKLRGALGTISPAAAEAAGLVDDLGDAVTVLASPVGLAVGAVGALALGYGALSVALVKAVFASDEALQRLEGFKKIGSDFYPAVPQSTLDSIAAVNASTDALQSIWDRAVVTLGGSVAPALERVTNTVVGLTMTGLEMFETWSRGHDILDEVAYFIAHQFTQGLTGPLKPLVLLGQGVEKLAELAGLELPQAARDAITWMDNLDEQLAEGAVGMLKESYAGSDLSKTLAGMEEKGDAFVKTQIRATRAMEKGKAAAEGMAKAYKESLAALDEDTAATRSFESALKAIEAAARAANEAQLTGIEKLQAKRRDDLASLQETYQEGVRAAAGRDDELLALAEQYEAARLAIIEESNAAIADERQRAADDQEGDERKRRDRAWEATKAAFGDLERATSSAAEAVGQTNAEAGMALFRVSQGAAVVQATMSAYEAAAKAAAAAASGGPIAAAAAGVATFALVEAAAVIPIATQAPPTFQDTPEVQYMARAGLVGFSEGDYVVAARDPQRLREQADELAGPRRQTERPAPPRAPAHTPPPVVVYQQRGTVVDERVTRFRLRGPGPLSRKLDQNSTAGKRRR